MLCSFMSCWSSYHDADHDIVMLIIILWWHSPAAACCLVLSPCSCHQPRPWKLSFKIAFFETFYKNCILGNCHLNCLKVKAVNQRYVAPSGPGIIWISIFIWPKTAQKFWPKTAQKLTMISCLRYCHWTRPWNLSFKLVEDGVYRCSLDTNF